MARVGDLCTTCERVLQVHKAGLVCPSCGQINDYIVPQEELDRVLNLFRLAGMLPAGHHKYTNRQLANQRTAVNRGVFPQQEMST